MTVAAFGDLSYRMFCHNAYLKLCSVIKQLCGVICGRNKFNERAKRAVEWAKQRAFIRCEQTGSVMQSQEAYILFRSVSIVVIKTWGIIMAAPSVGSRG